VSCANGALRHPYGTVVDVVTVLVVAVLVVVEVDVDDEVVVGRVVDVVLVDVDVVLVDVDDVLVEVEELVVEDVPVVVVPGVGVLSDDDIARRTMMATMAAMIRPTSTVMIAVIAPLRPSSASGTRGAVRFVHEVPSQYRRRSGLSGSGYQFG